VEPTSKFSGDTGVIAIEDNVGAGTVTVWVTVWVTVKVVVLDVHADATNVKVAINAIITL
jgi:hypothetical protein